MPENLCNRALPTILHSHSTSVRASTKKRHHLYFELFRAWEDRCQIVNFTFVSTSVVASLTNSFTHSFTLKRLNRSTNMNKRLCIIPISYWSWYHLTLITSDLSLYSLIHRTFSAHVLLKVSLCFEKLQNLFCGFSNKNFVNLRNITWGGNL